MANRAKVLPAPRIHPFNAPNHEILVVMEKLPRVVKWMRKSDKLPKKENGKWCDFHREGGYTTEQCRRLKNEIEELVEYGYLR